MIKLILENKASVLAYDPIASLKEETKIYGHKLYNETKNYSQAIKNVDALLICTEWKEFWSIDTSLFIKSMKKPVIFDGRNIYPLDKFAGTGIKYFGIGRNYEGLRYFTLILTRLFYYSNLFLG